MERCSCKHEDKVQCKAMTKETTYSRSHRCEKWHGVKQGYCEHHRGLRAKRS